MDEIRILIADDHQFFRDGVRGFLDSVTDVQVIGEAGSGEEAIAQALALQPDLILMDIQMPGLNGIEAARRILYTSPHIGVIIVSMFEDSDSIFAALRAGARGYVLKDADDQELLRAIRAVAKGESLFGAPVARRLVNFFASFTPDPPPLAFPKLTDRERELLNLIAQGQNNAEIATRLSLSEKTVRNHVSNILNKMQVADRTQAVLRAREAGLGLE